MSDGFCYHNTATAARSTTLHAVHTPTGEQWLVTAQATLRRAGRVPKSLTLRRGKKGQVHQHDDSSDKCQT